MTTSIEFSRTETRDAERSSFLTWFVVGAFLLGCFLLYKASPWGNQPERQSIAATPVAVQRTAAQHTKPIETVRVGDRAAPVKNPTGQFDDSLGRDVDPATWKRLTLKAEKRDGSDCDIELLRPTWWIEQRSAKTGGSVYVSVPECGIDGNAEVLAIEPCPPIQPGIGPIVIGTFAHQSAQVLNVYVEGLDEPIGVTANHPFWSDSRQDFVAAGDLRPGEKLVGLNGSPRITKILPRGPPEPVYNVEVLGEHVYQVSANGLLVHNSVTCAPGSRVGKFAYNMVENPGPLARLHGNPAANFAGGKYNATKLADDMVLYRGGQKGGGRNALGQWFTSEPPASVAHVRIDSAVKRRWLDPRTGHLVGESPVDAVYAIRIPKGTVVYEGPVGYQEGVYLGGQNKLQIFVPTPWAIKGVKVISETPLR